MTVLSKKRERQRFPKRPSGRISTLDELCRECPNRVAKLKDKLTVISETIQSTSIHKLMLVYLMDDELTVMLYVPNQPAGSYSTYSFFEQYCFVSRSLTKAREEMEWRKGLTSLCSDILFVLEKEIDWHRSNIDQLNAVSEVISSCSRSS